MTAEAFGNALTARVWLDVLYVGRRFRSLRVIGKANRESLDIEATRSMPTMRLINRLGQRNKMICHGFGMCEASKVLLEPSEPKQMPHPIGSKKRPNWQRVRTHNYLARSINTRPLQTNGQHVATNTDRWNQWVDFHPGIYTRLQESTAENPYFNFSLGQFRQRNYDK